MKPLNRREEHVYREIKTYGKHSYSRLYWFQENLARGKPNDWQCRAGARYLYICEDGLVHYCSQQRGYPGIPLEQYTFADIEREYFTKKTCAPHCTVGCVQKISVIDHWRDPQKEVAPPSERGRRDSQRAGAPGEGLKSLQILNPLPAGEGSDA